MKKILVVSVVGALAFAPAAFAQIPTLEAYKEGIDPDTASAIDVLPTADQSDGRDPGSDPQSSEVASAEADSLPFTGLDIGIVAALGVALVGTGFAMRRVSRSSQA